MIEATIEIGGMSCSHCVAAVKRALESLDGVKVDDVTVGSSAVRYDPAAVTPGQLARAVEAEGYTARVRQHPVNS